MPDLPGPRRLLPRTGTGPAPRYHFANCGRVDARPGQKAKTRPQEDEGDDAKHDEWPAALHGAFARLGPDDRRILTGFDMGGGPIRRDNADKIDATKIQRHTPYQAHESTPGHKNCRLSHKS